MHVTSEESVKAYRSVPTSRLDPLESKLGFSHLSIFSQSAERAARAAPNGVKKGATFLLLFRSLNHTDPSQKPFIGVQKGQVHSKKHKPSKKYFCGRSTQGSPPAALKRERCTYFQITPMRFGWLGAGAVRSVSHMAAFCCQRNALVGERCPALNRSCLTNNKKTLTSSYCHFLFASHFLHCR